MKFKIRLTAEIEHETEVEAATQDEAEEKAHNEALLVYPDVCFWFVQSVKRAGSQ